MNSAESTHPQRFFANARIRIEKCDCRPRLHRRQTGSWPGIASMDSTRIQLGHELEVTLAYVKGKDAESQKAQKHENSSSLALSRYQTGR
jgi:hypothetical protein